jgi:hypothetical protein
MNLPSRLILWAMTFILCFGVALTWFTYKTMADISAHEAAIEQSQFEMNDMNLDQKRLNRQQTLAAEQTATQESQEPTAQTEAENK